MRQWNLPRRAPDDGPARFGPLRLVAAAVMLLGTVTVGLQGAAAQDETFDYDQDGVAWSVDYDSSVWTDETGTTGDLQLSRDDETAALFTTLPDDGTIAFDTCLDDIVPDFEESASVEDASSVASGDGDGYVWELRDVTIAGQDGQTLHVCYDLGGPVLWAITIVPPGADDLDTVYDLMNAVSVEGDPVPVDFGDSRSGGSTPVASDDPAATPEASDDTEATPQAGSGDATTYEAPTLGYTFDYDESYWVTAEEGTTEPGRDAVRLGTEDDAVVMYVEGAEGEWDDTDECVSVLTEELVDPTGLDETVDPDSGDPLAVSGSDASIAAYTADQGVIYVACYADPDSDLIVGFSAAATGDEDDFFTDALPAIEDVTGSLAFAS